MKKNDLYYWLKLLHTDTVGPLTAAKLLAHYKTPEAIFNKASCHAISDKLKNALTTNKDKAIQADLAWLAKSDNHHIVLQTDTNYPPLLKATQGKPLLLFVNGNVKALSKPQLAMVGARSPTTLGLELATAFAKAIAPTLTITSGLARGIDAASHKGALATGKTVAVVGTGLDITYPHYHQALSNEIIAKGGAIVSEFPIGAQPTRHSFPRRNRIISGLSLGTLVVEAAIKSGSLITAKYALEQGRDVFALPGSLQNPLSFGCNQLIKEGAALVSQPQDLLDALNLATQTNAINLSQPTTDKFLTYFTETPIDINKLMLLTSLPLKTLLPKITHYLNKGSLRETPGGYIRSVKLE